jgi:cysteine sulfinate desulfinase/cysteine desulfurase-like protein
MARRTSLFKKEHNVGKSISAAALLATLTVAGLVAAISETVFFTSIAGTVAAQGMLLDFAADKVIKKYETATCEQLKVQKDEPRTEQEKMAIEFLRNDSQARVAFIDKVAAPILNKMFECGLIP